MEITEVRIKLMENAEDRLRAFCSVTFDNCFVIRDLKIIEGHSGPFVAMPSRKLTAHCRNCNTKNHLRARFCNQCGKRLASDRIDVDTQGRAKLYADIAHPINARCREQIQNHVIGEFFEELERARLPGYVSRYDDDYEDIARRRDAAPTRAIESGPESLRGPHKPADKQATPADVPTSNPGNHGGGGGEENDEAGGSEMKPDFGSGIF